MSVENSNHKLVQKSGLLFTLYMYGFLFLEQVILVFVSRNSDGEYSIAGYVLSLLGTALGYFIFGLKKYKDDLLIFSAFFVILLALIMIITNKYVVLLLAMISASVYGYIGGYIHYYISRHIGISKLLGRTLGCSLAVALVFQILVYNLINNTYIIAGSIMIALGFIEIILLCSKKDSYVTCLNEEKVEAACKHKIGLPIIIVTSITVIISLQDGEITRLEAIGELNVFGHVRLCYVVGALLAGIIADKKNKALLDICTIVCTFFAIIGTLFIGHSVLCIIAMGLIFLMSGFYVMYMEVKFIQISVSSNDPRQSQMQAGMGRMIRSIVAAVVILPAQLLYENFGVNALIIGSALSLMIMVAAYFYMVNIKQSQEIAEVVKNTEKNSRVRSVDKFISNYEFTPKEKEVCRYILQDNLITKEIADKLGISERSVQRHLTAIYSKTGVSSRNELYDSFYNP